MAEEQFITQELDQTLKLIKGGIDTALKGMWQNLPLTWPELMGEGFDKLQEFFGEVEEDAWHGLLGRFLNLDLITPKQSAELFKLKDLPRPWDSLAFTYLTISLTMGYYSIIGESGQSFLKQSLYQEHRPFIPSPGEVIRTAFVAPELAGEVRDVMRKSGLPEKYIDMLFLANYRLYDENMVRTLYHRNVLSSDQVFMRMRELGYTDTRTAEIMHSWDMLPGIGDILTMVAHEAFEPEFISKIGLADEFPIDQLPELRKHGLSDEWIRRYWYSHWEQPGIQQGFEMLHRGQIDLETLDLLFRAVEIPPFWRDKLTKIAYVPYTRVDVRRMWDLGVIKDLRELHTAYTDLGYDDEKAMNMVRFTLAYTQEHEKELSKSEVLTGYREKILTSPEAKNLLMDINYTDAQADYLILYEDYKEQKEYQEAVIDNTKERFQALLITEYDARRILNDLNLPAMRTDLLIDAWKIKTFKDTKLPSKTDLDKFFKAKIINMDTYHQEMHKLGYSTQYTEWYAQLVQKK